MECSIRLQGGLIDDVLGVSDVESRWRRCLLS